VDLVALLFKNAVKMGKHSQVEPLVIWEVLKFPAFWKTTDINNNNAFVKENAWREVVEAVGW